MTKKHIEKQLSKLFQTFYKHRSFIIVNCSELYNNYHIGDEVVTYKYKVQIIVSNKLYTYDGWCYKEDLDQIALGIYSHWLLNNCKIYDGPSSAWYKMYTGIGNLEEKKGNEDFE